MKKQHLIIFFLINITPQELKVDRLNHVNWDYFLQNQKIKSSEPGVSHCRSHLVEGNYFPYGSLKSRFALLELGKYSQHVKSTQT